MNGDRSTSRLGRWIARCVDAADVIAGVNLRRETGMLDRDPWRGPQWTTAWEAATTGWWIGPFSDERREMSDAKARHRDRRGWMHARRMSNRAPHIPFDLRPCPPGYWLATITGSLD